MKIHNTLTRSLEEFKPLDAGHVRMYTCGPTVYNFAHIGNFRTYIFEDLLRRYLKYLGYRVTQVMNLTDVDDKTIKGANEKGVPLVEYTKTFKDAFFADLKTLNIEAAEYYPAATDHVPEMIELIQKLFDRGIAYKSDDGSIYFGISRFGNYGKLAHLDMSGLRAGARVAQDEYEKESVSDFALWKTWDEKDGPVAWDSPWGRGRPGWHIECSAMSMKYLGETFDIHTGGVDNMFPHHENELAQSEGATGKPFVNYWMHSSHLVVDGRKMSKSFGNFHTLRDIMDRGYTGREIRYLLLSAHYRVQLNFTFHALDAARASLARLDEFSARLGERASTEQGGGLPDWAARAKAGFAAALDNDLGISDALAAVFDMIHEGNRAMDRQDGGWSARAVLDLLSDLDRVLGFLVKEQGGGVPAEIAGLVEDRVNARKAKNWAESDRIRDLLASKGWEIRDSAQGPKLRKL